MIKAAIFDMDGTMVDSENMWKEVNVELAEKYGKVFEEGLRAQMMGRKEDDALNIFRNYYNINESVAELQRIRKEMIMQRLNMIAVNPGLLQLLDLLDKKNIVKAVATSAFADFAIKVLDHINVKNRFNVIITGDQVTNGKPNPEMFLRAAKELNIDPAFSLVFEDAQNGVEAAYNAHMKVVAISHIHNKTHDFSKATKVVDSMVEINLDMLNNL